MGIEEYRKDVFEIISNIFANYTVYAKNINGVSNISLFNEFGFEGRKRKNEMRRTDIIVFDQNTPFLAIETLPTYETSPREIAGVIPIFAITKYVSIKRKGGGTFGEYELDNPLLLLLVIPDVPEGSDKDEQFVNLEDKVKAIMNLESNFSNLKDFKIVELSDLKNILKKFFEDNELSKYAENIQL